MSEYWNTPVWSRVGVLTLLFLMLSAGMLIGAGWTEHNIQRAMEKQDLYYCQNNTAMYGEQSAPLFVVNIT